MKKSKYTGTFKSAEGNIYELTSVANGFIQAFFLLTANAISLGKHYQLNTITDDNGNVVEVDNICKISKLLKSI